MQAMAIDIRMPGVKTSELRDLHCRCGEAGLVTMRSRTSCTWMRAVCDVGDGGKVSFQLCQMSGALCTPV